MTLGYRTYRGFIRVIFWDNGKENGNYRDYRGYIGGILGLYWGFKMFVYRVSGLGVSENV